MNNYLNLKAIAFKSIDDFIKWKEKQFCDTQLL